MHSSGTRRLGLGGAGVLGLLLAYMNSCTTTITVTLTLMMTLSPSLTLMVTLNFALTLTHTLMVTLTIPLTLRGNSSQTPRWRQL